MAMELNFFFFKIFSRVFPYLCRAVGNFARDHVEENINLNDKEYYVAFVEVQTRHK